MQTIKTVIIEDEIQLREINRMLLFENFPNIEIVGEAGCVEDAVAILQKEKPELVLCDIELEDGNIFQVLQRCKPYTFRPVFITAFNQYAIKAIKFSAMDYILKPVNEYEFCEAIQKAIDNIELGQVQEQTEQMEATMGQGGVPKKIVLRTVDAMHLVDVDDVMFCKSDNSYTTFYLAKGEKIMVSRSLKEYAELFTGLGFLRPHQSYLVNINRIVRIDKTDGGFIVMESGNEIPISSRRKHIIFEELERL